MANLVHPAALLYGRKKLLCIFDRQIDFSKIWMFSFLQVMLVTHYVWCPYVQAYFVKMGWFKQLQPVRRRCKKLELLSQTIKSHFFHNCWFFRLFSNLYEQHFFQIATLRPCGVSQNGSLFDTFQFSLFWIAVFHKCWCVFAHFQATFSR